MDKEPKNLTPKRVLYTFQPIKRESFLLDSLKEERRKSLSSSFVFSKKDVERITDIEKYIQIRKRQKKARTSIESQKKQEKVDPLALLEKLMKLEDVDIKKMEEKSLEEKRRTMVLFQPGQKENEDFENDPAMKEFQKRLFDLKYNKVKKEPVEMQVENVTHYDSGLLDEVQIEEKKPVQIRTDLINGTNVVPNAKFLEKTGGVDGVVYDEGKKFRVEYLDDCEIRMEVINDQEFDILDISIIERLMNLGFDKSTVAKVFVTFHRNEYASANFLLDCSDGSIDQKLEKHEKAERKKAEKKVKGKMKGKKCCVIS